MKKRLLCILGIALSVLLLCPVTAAANGMPGNSVTLELKGLGAEDQCWGSLMVSGDKRPASLMTGPYTQEEEKLVEEYRSFAKDNGLIFLGDLQRAGDSGALVWERTSPQEFRFLLYFPEYNSWVVSQPVGSYAYHSSFSLELSAGQLEKVREGRQLLDGVEAIRDWQYGKELLGAGIRFLLTFAIEMGIALLFGYRRKKQVLFLLGVNFFTQLGLNLALFLFVYRFGGSVLEIIVYFLLELLIFLVEGGLYAGFLKRWETGERRRGAGWAFLYSLAANAASFAAGIALASLWPEMFF